MAGYIGSKASVVSSGAERKTTVTATSGQTSLTGLSYTPNHVHVFQNGVRLVDGTDYTATNGSSITLTVGASTDDQIVVVSYATYQNADSYTKAEADARYVEGDDTLYVDQTNNRVGVGTSSPSSAIHAVGGAGANIAIQSTAGSHWRLGDAVGATNGTFVLYDYTNSGVRLAVNSSGAINQPSQPAFQVTKSGHQSNIAVGVATVTFDTEVFDQGSNFSSNGFTAPVTGKYQLSLMLYLDNLDSAANYYQAWIATSNRSYYSIFDPDYGQDNGYMFINASILADMDANDVAYVGIEMGANGNAQTDINATTKFSGFLVA